MEIEITSQPGSFVDAWDQLADYYPSGPPIRTKDELREAIAQAGLYYDNRSSEEEWVAFWDQLSSDEQWMYSKTLP